MSKSTLLTVVAVIACAVAGLARADDEQALSRDQVKRELALSKASGEHDAIHAEDSGSSWLARRAVPSKLTNAPVEPGPAVAGNHVDPKYLTGEDSGSFYLAELAERERTHRVRLLAVTK